MAKLLCKKKKRKGRKEGRKGEVKKTIKKQGPGPGYNEHPLENAPSCRKLCRFSPYLHVITAPAARSHGSLCGEGYISAPANTKYTHRKKSEPGL